MSDPLLNNEYVRTHVVSIATRMAKNKTPVFILVPDNDKLLVDEFIENGVAAENLAPNADRSEQMYRCLMEEPFVIIGTESIGNSILANKFAVLDLSR